MGHGHSGAWGVCDYDVARARDASAPGARSLRFRSAWPAILKAMQADEPIGTASAAAGPQWWRRTALHLGLFSVILCAAAGLRLHRLTEDSMWLDELFSLASSTGRYPDLSPLRVGEVMTPWPEFTSTEEARPWWYVWASHRAGTHPPLYLIILRGWREVFGDGDF